MKWCVLMLCLVLSGCTISITSNPVDSPVMMSSYRSNNTTVYQPRSAHRPATVQVATPQPSHTTMPAPRQPALKKGVRKRIAKKVRPKPSRRLARRR